MIEPGASPRAEAGPHGNGEAKAFDPRCRNAPGAAPPRVAGPRPPVPPPHRRGTPAQGVARPRASLYASVGFYWLPSVFRASNSDRSNFLVLK
jgi:hypothetical protein